MTVSLPFIKMDGTGNDFIIIDARTQPIIFSKDQVMYLSDHKNEITGGCDQFIVMEPSSDADCFMRIYNADGTEVDACGNASRCIPFLLMEEKGTDSVLIQTNAGILMATRQSANEISVDMGEARLEWHDIPLRETIDTLHLPIRQGALKYPTAVSMGNPHAVFFVDNVDDIELAIVGPSLEHHPLFPEQANIGVAHIAAPDHIVLRVFERGVGETAACGTGACAALVAAHRRGLTGRKARISLKGGDLEIEWMENNHVLMTGAVNYQREGTLDLPEEL